MAEVVVGGVQVSRIAHVGDLKWSHARKGGCADASWEASFGVGYINDTFRQGATVEIWNGVRVWKGILAEPKRGATWRMYARGLGSLAAGYACLDSGGAPTSIPTTAIDQAITRGLPWVRTQGFSNSSFSASATNLNNLEALLDAWVREQTGAVDWAVDKDGYLTWSQDATTVSYRAAWTGQQAEADDDYITHVYAQRVSAVDATTGRATAWAPATAADNKSAARWGRREDYIDLTELGVISAGRASSLVTGRLNEGRARPQFADPIIFGEGDLRTVGGAKVALAHVKANEVVEILGALDTMGSYNPTLTTKFVIGRTDYNDDTKTLTIYPVGFAPRRFTDVMAAMKKEQSAKRFIGRST
jgi:hypothetical protein